VQDQAIAPLGSEIQMVPARSLQLPLPRQQPPPQSASGLRAVT
jgi:hypothetical protein